ncbi:hypothetical protein DITRI_Ditri14bG0044900 [Diplodiscus trichospermus]
MFDKSPQPVLAQYKGLLFENSRNYKEDFSLFLGGECERWWKFRSYGAKECMMSWTSLLGGYAQNGMNEEVSKSFLTMRMERVKPNPFTWLFLELWRMKEAAKVFEQIDVRDSVAWSAMLAGYAQIGDSEGASKIFIGFTYAQHGHAKKAIKPQDSAAYVLLSNIFAAAGNWHERRNVRKLMEKRKVKKEAGYRWIEVKNETHSFLASDLSHFMTLLIDEHKETILSQHSERLAIAFRLTDTPPGTALQIVKNPKARINSHTVIELISLNEGRDIIMRDTNCFHHFKARSFYCGD